MLKVFFKREKNSLELCEEKQDVNLRKRDRKGKSFPQVHTHEGHIGHAVNCRCTPGNSKDNITSKEWLKFSF